VTLAIGFLFVGITCWYSGYRIGCALTRARLAPKLVTDVKIVGLDQNWAPAEESYGQGGGVEEVPR
jgi:hypothetical protein